jgi:2-hydroxy-6-oxonona-2,4-dienedioate hydrolase
MHDKSHVNDDLVATRQTIYSSPGAAQAMVRALILQEMDVRQRNLLVPNDWARIRAETLVLWTDHDPTNPVEEGRRIASMISNAIFTSWPVAVTGLSGRTRRRSTRCISGFSQA